MYREPNEELEVRDQSVLGMKRRFSASNEKRMSSDRTLVFSWHQADVRNGVVLRNNVRSEILMTSA